MVELIDDFIVAVVRIHRHDRHAEAVEREILHEKFRTVLQQQGNAVAMAVTGLGITAGRGQGLVQHPLIGKLSSFRAVVALRPGRDTQKRGIRTSCSGCLEDLEDAVHEVWLLCFFRSVSEIFGSRTIVRIVVDVRGCRIFDEARVGRISKQIVSC